MGTHFYPGFLFYIKKKYIYLFYVYVCGCTYMWYMIDKHDSLSEDKLHESVLFYHVGAREQTQAVSLGAKGLHLLSHLAVTSFFCVCVCVW